MTIDIDAIRQREQAATEGPWIAHPDGLVWTEKPIPGDPVSGSVELADAEFIAHARQDIPALLAELARAESALEDARYSIDQVLAQKYAALGEANRLRAQVADLADKLHKANAENASLTKAGTAWANEVDGLRGIETAVLHMLALAPDEYRQCIAAARASMSGDDYAKNNGRAEMIRVFATGLAERAGLPVIDWEQIKRNVPADGVYRAGVAR